MNIMQKVMIVFAVCVFSALVNGEEKDSTTITATGSGTQPMPFTLKMINPERFDSVLALVPKGDSIKQADRIIGIGRITGKDSVIIFTLDNAGNVARNTHGTTVPSAEAIPPGTKTTPETAKKKIEQEGRTWFMVWSTLKAMGIYPSSFANAFEPRNAQTITGLSLLAVGGTLYGTYLFTRGMELGYGKVGLMNYGGSLGVTYPLLTSTLLHNGTSIDKRYLRIDTLYEAKDPGGPHPPTEWDTIIVDNYDGVTTSAKIGAWGAMLGYPIGIYLGSLQKYIGKNDFGRASAISYFGESGLVLGYALPFYFYDVDKNTSEFFTAAPSLAMALIPAGVIGGYHLVKDRQMSSGRGTLLYVTGIMGAVSGGLLPTLFEPEIEKYVTEQINHQRLYVSTTIAGYGAGTYLGLNLFPDRQYTFWQAVFMGASSIGGSLVCLAIPFIAQTDFEHHHQAYTVAGLAGAWGGFFLGEKLSRALFESPLPGTVENDNFHFSVPALAALPSLLSKHKTPQKTAYQLFTFDMKY